MRVAAVLRIMADGKGIMKLEPQMTETKMGGGGGGGLK